MEASKHIIRETSLVEIERIYNFQKANKLNISRSTVSERKKKLKNLLITLNAYRSEIKEALYKDCKRDGASVDMTEMYPAISEIKHAIRDLNSWTKRRKVKTPIAMLGSSSYVQLEAKGNTLIISPWNFPVNLTLCPLASAIAAGNVIMIKPSEHAPNTSAVLKRIIEDCFDEDEVALLEGGAETAINILKLKFDHIFFTGSPEIGKRVMSAASEHLCSVTLELGGKSPTIVDATADIDTAARRICWAKFSNNGQICIAPDYVLIDRKVKDEFCEKVKFYLHQFYGDDPTMSESYSRIINSSHYNSKKEMLDDALANGAKIVSGGRTAPEDNYMEPTVLKNVDMDSQVMQKEIFGPILPIVAYESIDDAIEIVNSKEKALALYIYSKSNSNINNIISSTSAGGTCINHNSAHYFNTNLPFGGVNNSGIGRAHGYAGFKEFSNERAIFRQHIPNALDLLMPPYNDFKQKLIDITLKYF